MSKTLLKSTFREISGSLGRYIAILLICALGVGFFSGLKLTKSSMVHSADVYYEMLSFYDYKLVSTIGFDENTAGNLEKDALIDMAEAGKSADIVAVTDDGKSRTIKTLSMPEKINKLKLIEGRLPKKTGECVVDNRMLGVDNIGRTLTFSPENENEDLENFKCREYTITGVVYSPIYGSHERGTTSLGTGKIDGFIYIPYDDYDMDYDTEIYVRLAGERGEIYSDEYDEMQKRSEKRVGELSAELANARYDRLLAEANEKLLDAKKELADGKEDGEKELADAWEEIEKGRREIADGDKAIKDAKSAIYDGEKKISDSEKEYKDGKKEYDDNLKKYNKGKTAYDDAKKTYDANLADYNKGMKEYEAGKSAYDESLADYKAQREAFEAGKDYLPADKRAETEAKLAVWKTKLDETGTALATTKLQLDTAGSKLSEGKKTLDATEKQLATAKKKLDSAKKQLDLAPGKIADAKEELEKGRSEIRRNESKLADAKKEFDDGLKEYEDGKKEFDEEIADAEKKIADAEKELDDVEEPETYELGRDTNVAYVSYESDAGIVDELAGVFPLFFFLVAALVCVTTMTRMLEDQRTQIGVLKALGYSGTSIVIKYLSYSGSAALIGGVLGYFGGAWLFPYVIGQTYKMMYHLGSFRYVLNAKLAVISVTVAFACSAGTTFIACGKELSENSASLMRPKAPKAGKRVLLERVDFIWKRLKFLDKVSVRNLFRYKKRFFMMIIGISGCTALIVTGFGIKDSIANFANDQYDKIFTYDMEINIKDEPAEIDGEKQRILCYEKSMDITNSGITKALNLVVPDDETDFSDYFKTRTLSGDDIGFPASGEIVISSDIAKRLGIKTGDKIEIKNSDHKGGSVVVSGIFENYVGHYAFMTADTYENIFKEKPDYNTMFVNGREGADIHALAAEFLKDGNVKMVSVSSDTKDRVSNMMKSLNLVVLLVIGCAGLLAFVVIFNLNNINITERLRESATIKVLGFYRDETNSYVFRENVVLTFFGGLFGLVLGYGLHSLVMHSIHVDGFCFKQRITVLSYVISLVITMVFNRLVSVFMSGKLEQINMAESLKSVD